MADYEAEININTGKGGGRGKKKPKTPKEKAGAFAGGLVGSLLGSLLASVKALFDPIAAIATLLIVALFPLLKPFLILFIKIGLLLFKFLNKMLGTTSEVAGVAGKTGAGETVVGELGKKIALWIGIILGAIALIALAFFTSIPAAIIGIITIAVVVLGKWLVEGLIWIGAKLFEFGVWLGEKFMEFISWISDTLWPMIQGWFTKAWEVLKDFGTWIWDGLISIFTTSLEKIGDFGTWIWDSLVSVFTTAFDVLKNIGIWIKDAVLGFFGIGSGGDDTSVNDAIITPNGDIIRTDPSDYLIATKTPGSLGEGGGAGGSKKIEVNINGGLITDEVARDIGRIILRETNFGGGF